MSNATANPSTVDEVRVLELQRRAFHVHATVFAVSMVIIFGVNLAVNAAAGIIGEWSAWWSGWALIGWGLGVTVHGLVVKLAQVQNANPV